MSLSDDIKRRLNFAKNEMAEAGIGDGGLLYDTLQKLGLPIPPLSYGSFFLNFVVVTAYTIIAMGAFWIIYALIAAKSFDVATATKTVLCTPEAWIVAVVTGTFGGLLSVYQRRKFKLTKWDVI